NRIGLLHAFMPWSKIGLNDSEETLAELLKEKGYATSFVGKWHLGHQAPFLPTRHGYDEWLGLPYSNDMWPVDFDGKPVDSEHWKTKYPPLPLMDGEETVDVIANLDEQGTLTRRYTDRALEFIERQAKQGPFFLELAHSMPHVPLGASKEFQGKTEYGPYGDVIEEIDSSTGEILAALDRLGIADNTLVIFTSDNGPWLNFGDHAGLALPLKEGKGTMWEGGCRVPCIMRFPGRIPAGTVSSGMAASVDLLPTIAAVCTAPLPRHAIDGMSLWPHLRNPETPSPRTSYWFYYGRQLQAVRQGPWKLHVPHKFRTYERLTPGTNGHPGPTGTGRVSTALFNLDEDPGERLDVADLHPEIVQELMKVVADARAELGDGSLQGAGARESGKVD
ncbi:MAG: arylsulfatase A-like enzyme, partial [Candidatus Paceibacteria bacterium]